MAELEHKIDEHSDDIISEKKTSAFDEIFDWLESLVFAFFVVILIFTFLFRIVNVEGRSMVPTLNNNDKLILTTMFYTPEVGDIVVVNVDSAKDRYIKRVIAKEGQTVDIDFDTGTVTIDGEIISEPYINELTKFDGGAFTYPVEVPTGHVFVMGDNRNHSTDSRDSRVGFVSEGDVVGKAVYRIFPIKDFGNLYD